VAHLGMSVQAGEAQEPVCLPTTAMVFAEVEGGRALVRRKPELARPVHNTLTHLLQVRWEWTAAHPAGRDYDAD
jgi:hypothetical protein